MVRQRLRYLVLATVLLAVSSGSVAGAVDADRPLDSGDLLWAGQSVSFNGSEVVTDIENASVPNRTFEIRKVTGGEVGSLVREFVIPADGGALLDTAGLEGRYVIRHQGQVVYVQDGVGYTSSPPDGTDVDVETSDWEVARQTLSASWSEDRVFRNDVVDLEIDSNRAAFQLEVSADGLDFDDLVSMFDADDFADDHDRKADDDILRLDIQAPAALSVRFAELDNGRYELVLAVADADARTSTRIQVGRQREPTPTGTPDLAVTPTRTPSPTTAATPTVSIPSPSPPTSPATGTSPGVGSPDRSPATTLAESPTASPGQSGFGIALTVVALLVALLARRGRGGSAA